jgi:hypothetical protein
MDREDMESSVTSCSEASNQLVLLADEKFGPDRLTHLFASYIM